MTYPASGGGWPQPPANTGPAPYGPPAQYPPAQQYPPQQGQYQQYPPPQQHHQGQQYQQGQYQQAQGGTYTARFIKHTGMLILWQQSTATSRGSFEQIAADYRSAQQHCLLAGWWSISSILAFNWYALIKNAVVFGKVKREAGR